MTPRTQEAEVVEIRHLCPDVREMVLRPLGHAITFQPGQWISVHLPIGEKPVIRAYTLAEPMSDCDTVVLCFDRVKEGAASTFLFQVAVGDRLTISDALGIFVLPSPLDRGVALVTWFTGIVPMRCMLLELAKSSTPPPQTLLVYGAPNADELPYHAWLQALEREHHWFRYEAVLPATGASMEESVEQVLRRLPEALKRAFPEGAGPATVHPMIAGVRALVLPARAWFMDNLGYERTQVQKETYD